MSHFPDLCDFTHPFPYKSVFLNLHIHTIFTNKVISKAENENPATLYSLSKILEEELETQVFRQKTCFFLNDGQNVSIINLSQNRIPILYNLPPTSAMGFKCSVLSSKMCHFPGILHIWGREAKIMSP